MYISPLTPVLPLGYSCYITLWKIRSSVEMCVGICNINNLLLCENVTIDEVMLNSCLSLFTNMRSKSERRLLGQGFDRLCSIDFVLLYTHQLRYSCSFFFVRLTHCIRFSKSGVKCPWGEMYEGWNVFGVKCLRGEMSLGWNVPGWNVLGWNVFGVKCRDIPNSEAKYFYSLHWNLISHFKYTAQKHFYMYIWHLQMATKKLADKCD